MLERLFQRGELKRNAAIVQENKAGKAPNFYHRQNYTWYREHLKIDTDMILLEALDGAHPTGNVAALIKELNDNPAFGKFKLYLSGRDTVYQTRLEYVKSLQLDRVTVLVSDTDEYYRILASAKYLITETSFSQIFIKRPEQVYFNTWHGTPLKTLGKKIKNDHAMLGNLQKNFFETDYLLYPNEFTMNCMVEDYMLANFCKSQILLSGYPRNYVFHDKARREEVRRACGFTEDMQCIGFMPTWRGAMSNVNGVGQNEQLCAYFDELDNMLTDKQVMFVKLHYMNAAGIDLSGYTRIKPFPLEFDGYEFLNAMDVLVTDYSSVFFDYAITGQKIVLFTYDLEEYTRDRGFYLSLDELPFPKVRTLKELVEEISRPKEYDDTAFLQRFCPYERPGVTEALLRKVLFEEDSPLFEQRPVPDNGKKNVLLYIGGFGKNELTAAAVKLLHAIDRTKYNYAVVFPMDDIRKRQSDIDVLPPDVDYHGFYQWRSATPSEFVDYMRWKANGKVPYAMVKKLMHKICARECARMFGPCRIDAVVQFSGYYDEVTAAFEQLPCRRSIYVYRDMAEVCKGKKNMDEAFYGDMYNRYDAVAVSSEDVLKPTRELARRYHPKRKESANLVLCREIIDQELVLFKASRELSMDGVSLNVCRERFFDALENKQLKKFVAMGSFSKEKGYDRLVDAFAKVHAKYPDTCLFILGETGAAFADLAEKIRGMSCDGAVYLVKNLSNPYPLLKECDYYVSASFDEGLGTGLADADILGLPCVATDVPGNHAFMKLAGGYLAENNEAGVEKALQDCLEGSVPKKLSMDYKQYNQEAIAQFESLLP